MVSTRTRKAPAAEASHGHVDVERFEPFIHGLYRPGGLRRLRRVFSRKARSTGRRISASVRRPRESAVCAALQPEDRMGRHAQGPRPEHRQGHAAGPDDGRVSGKGDRLTAKGGGDACILRTSPSGSLGANGIVGGGMPDRGGVGTEPAHAGIAEYHRAFLR